MVDRFILLGAVDAMMEVLFQKDSDDEVGHAIYHNYILCAYYYLDMCFLPVFNYVYMHV